MFCCYCGDTAGGKSKYPKEDWCERKFNEAFPGVHHGVFPGEHLSDIPRLEQYFQLDINIFELNWIDGKSCGKIILRSKGLFKTEQLLCLIAFQGHFYLIKKGC